MKNRGSVCCTVLLFFGNTVFDETFVRPGFNLARPEMDFQPSVPPGFWHLHLQKTGVRVS
jgi:hypothetical protein